MSELMQGPIPGQSLTDLPKNSPWENPSELNEVADVIRHYVERIADDEVMDDLSIVFELGGDLKTVTETVMMTGSMNGTHTVEAGMLAGPVVASFIKAAMKSYGIDTPETNVDPDTAAAGREYARVMALVDQALEQGGKDQGINDAGQNLLRDMLAANPESSDDEALPPDVAYEEEPEETMNMMAAPDEVATSERGLGSRIENNESLEGEE